MSSGITFPADKSSMKLFIPIFILISNLAAWADCRVPQGNSFVVVGEGQTITLLSEGRPLANLKIQDQDGMGTCYANTASTMLKSVLPGNPDLSYLHLAVQTATNGVRNKFDPSNPQYWRMGNENKMESFADGGFICETVTALKKIGGGACKREQSLLESDMLASDLQEKSFKNLGIYFDALNKAKQNPSDLEKFKKDVVLAVEAINNEKNNLRMACEEQKRAELPLEAALTKFLGDMYFNMNDDSFCSKIRLESFKKLTVDSVFQSDRTRIKPGPEFTNKIKAAIEADPALKSMLVNKAAGKSLNRLKEIDMAKVLGTKILAIYNSVVPTKSSLPVCSGEPPDTSASSNNLTVGDQFIYDVKDVRKSTCAIENEAVLTDVFSHNSCIAPTNLEMILAAVKPLMEVGQEINQNTINHLLNPNATSAGQLKNLLMPGCYKPENQASVANVSCSTYAPCDPGNIINADNVSYNGPAGGCKDLTTAITDTRKLILNGLTSNRALGVSVCTSFMVNPSQKTDYCKNKGQGVEKHTYHAMTVSGLRCTNGKMEYQLVNSWGKNNCPAGAGLPNSPLKCEKDAKGLNTGKFWITEDVMVDSMTGLSEMKNGGL